MAVLILAGLKRKFWSAVFASILVLLFTGCGSLQHFHTHEGERKINKILDGEDLPAGHLGIAIYDLEEKEYLYRYQSGKRFTPASNTKLVTYLLSREILGDSLPALHYFESNDSLYFWGTADASFLYGHLPGMQLAFNFLSEFEGHLVFYVPDVSVKRFGPGWAWDDYDFKFQVERSLFPLYGNRVKFIFMQTDVEEVIMTSIPDYFESWLTVNRDQDRLLEREEAVNAFTFNPRQLSGPYAEREVPFVPDDYMILQLLKDTLDREVSLSYELPADPKTAQTLYHNNLDSLYRRLICHSDNFVAEQLLLAIAKKYLGRYDTGSLLEWAEESWLPRFEGAVKWVDGSGLSRYNAFSPEFLISVLREIYRMEGTGKFDLIYSRPGISGSLYGDGFTAQEYVHAKSGSMESVFNVSGFLKTSRGKMLAFSIMSNHHGGEMKDWRSGIDRILRRIHTEY